MSVSAADSVAVAQELPFCLGAAIISIAHAGEARDAVEDLNEAIAMVTRHRDMLLADRAALRAEVAAEITTQFPGLTEAMGWNPVVHNPDGTSHMIIPPTE